MCQLRSKFRLDLIVDNPYHFDLHSSIYILRANDTDWDTLQRPVATFINIDLFQSQHG